MLLNTPMARHHLSLTHPVEQHQCPLARQKTGGAASVPWLRAWSTTKTPRQDYTKPPLEPQSRAWGTKPHISPVLVAMQCILLGGLGRQATDLSEVADHAWAGDHTCSGAVV